MVQYKMAELARAAGMNVRTVRYYQLQKLLPPVKHRGKGTRYGDEHLTQLRVIQRLREAERLQLKQIRARLAKMTREELVALGAAEPAPAPASEPSTTQEAAPAVVGDLWERVPLLPGLELLLKHDAAPVVRRFAAEIRAQCPGVA
jgi:DNA-binding transcriptional MerR regulator